MPQVASDKWPADGSERGRAKRQKLFRRLADTGAGQCRAKVWGPPAWAPSAICSSFGPLRTSVAISLRPATPNGVKPQMRCRASNANSAQAPLRYCSHEYY
uniref:Uncharacterized protein n=1 Tax=Trichuris muris TaxID=70415 RepID=A0A5S6QE79_TRIMR